MKKIEISFETLAVIGDDEEALAVFARILKLSVMQKSKLVEARMSMLANYADLGTTRLVLERLSNIYKLLNFGSAGIPDANSTFQVEIIADNEE